MSSSITLRVGQVIPWPAAPMGMAQITELRRSKVRIVYPHKHGRRRSVAQPIVAAAKVAELLTNSPLIFQMENLYQRGVVPRSKVFQISRKSPPPQTLYLRRAA